MKKILSTLIAALVALSFSAVVFAADAVVPASAAPAAVEKKEAKPAKKTKKTKKTKQEKADKRLKKEVDMPGGQ
jgi:ribosomal protein L12E/L44/L45/RPP1/RPP2